VTKLGEFYGQDWGNHVYKIIPKLALSVLVILIICPEVLHGETLSPEEARRGFQPGRNAHGFSGERGEQQ